MKETVDRRKGEANFFSAEGRDERKDKECFKCGRKNAGTKNGRKQSKEMCFNCICGDGMREVVIT